MLSTFAEEMTRELFKDRVLSHLLVPSDIRSNQICPELKTINYYECFFKTSEELSSIAPHILESNKLYALTDKVWHTGDFKVTDTRLPMWCAALIGAFGDKVRLYVDVESTGMIPQWDGYTARMPEYTTLRLTFVLLK